jgi:dCMP deaminase
MTVSAPNWDDINMIVAFAYAMKSKDPATKVGAVIVGPDNEPRSVGFNGLPRGLDDHKPERYERPAKYRWCEHAERNAIYHGPRTGVSFKGCRIYVTLCPCMDCARGIIQSGITEVIINRPFTDAYIKASPNSNWQKDFEEVESMLTEAGVTVRWYEQITPPVQAFLNGNWV